MKYQAPLTTPAVDVEQPLATEYEDLSEQHGTTGRPGSWTLVVVAMTSAIIGFGFVGHQLDGPGHQPPTPVPSSAAAASQRMPNRPIDELTIARPIDGDVIDGSTIRVRAEAAVPLGRIHMAAMVGTDELGSTDVAVTKAGPFGAWLPIIEPGWPIRIELRVTQATGPTAGTLLATRSLLSGSRSTVGLLDVSAAQTRRHLVLTVDGWVPAGSSSVQAHLVDRSGRDMAAADATVGSAEGWGGAMLASRPFKLVLEPAVVVPGTLLRLVLTWRDPATGEVDSASQTLTVPQPARVRVP